MVAYKLLSPPVEVWEQVLSTIILYHISQLCKMEQLVEGFLWTNKHKKFNTKFRYVPAAKRCCSSCDGHLAISRCFMEEKLMNLNQWLEKSNSIKKYAHFDRRVSIKTVWNEIKEPQNIITHAFLPFIHSPLIFHKYYSIFC